MQTLKKLLFLRPAACLLLALALAGCGVGIGDMADSSGNGYTPGVSGGGGSSTPGGGTIGGGGSTPGGGTISGGGIIIGGVGTGGTGVVKSSALAAIAMPGGSTGFAGAIVFIDSNRNSRLDADEVFAYTNGQGGYTLPAAAGAPPDAQFMISAVAGATIDLATGQVVQESFCIPLPPNSR